MSKARTEARLSKPRCYERKPRSGPSAALRSTWGSLRKSSDSSLSHDTSSYPFSLHNETCLCPNSTSSGACRQRFVSKSGFWLAHQLNSFTQSGLHARFHGLLNQPVERYAQAISTSVSSARRHHLFYKHAENLDPCCFQPTYLASPARGRCFLCNIVHGDGFPELLRTAKTRCRGYSFLAIMKLSLRIRTGRSIGTQETISSSSTR
jgi:hypothetical protein